jgi:hypothetical protein
VVEMEAKPMSAEYFHLWRASRGALKVNGEGALGANGEGVLGVNGEGALGTNGEGHWAQMGRDTGHKWGGALGTNREGALKVNGEGALKVGSGVLAGASMDVVRAWRKGSVVCSLSDRGQDTSTSPVSSPSPLPPSAILSSSCSLFSGLSWRGWNMFSPLVHTADSIIMCMLK